jgi:hypothetical protein
MWLLWPKAASRRRLRAAAVWSSILRRSGADNPPLMRAVQGNSGRGVDAEAARGGTLSTHSRLHSPPEP